MKMRQRTVSFMLILQHKILNICQIFVPAMWCVALVPVGEKEAEDKDVNSEAPSSLSEATSDKESNSVKSKKDEERNNSIKKVNLRIKFKYV